MISIDPSTVSNQIVKYALENSVLGDIKNCLMILRKKAASYFQWQTSNGNSKFHHRITSHRNGLEENKKEVFKMLNVVDYQL